MKGERVFMLVLGLVPACWMGWHFATAAVPPRARPPGAWLFLAWFMLPGILACAIAVAPRRVVRWFWERLLRFILAFLGGSGVVVALGIYFEPEEIGFNLATALAAGFGISGVVLLVLSAVGSRRVVERVIDYF